jgi:hypothetical protein
MVIALNFILPYLIKKISQVVLSQILRSHFNNNNNNNNNKFYLRRTFKYFKKINFVKYSKFLFQIPHSTPIRLRFPVTLMCSIYIQYIYIYIYNIEYYMYRILMFHKSQH